MDTYPELPAVTLNPNMPGYARVTIEADQRRMDEEFLHGAGNSVDHFMAVVDAWTVAEVAARAASTVQANYQPRPFPGALPVRMVEDWDDSINWFVRRPTRVPWLTVPTQLPDYVKPTELPKGISSTSASAVQDDILNRLSDIQADLTRIINKMGIVRP